jgi:hypothetical protein
MTFQSENATTKSTTRLTPGIIMSRESAGEKPAFLKIIQKGRIATIKKTGKMKRSTRMCQG